MTVLGASNHKKPVEKIKINTSPRKLSPVLLAILVVVLFCLQSVHSQLQIGFYKDTCSLAEFIVKEEVTKAFIRDKGVAAGLMRLHFHDCFVRGCDGSVLLDSTPSSTAQQRKTPLFANKGLTQEETVTLSGGHTIGRSHCTSFTDRLYNFSGTLLQDPSLDPRYAAILKQGCPQAQGSTNTNLVVPMTSSPSIIDAGYYVDVLANRGLFTSDHALLTSPATANQGILCSGRPNLPWQW